MNGSRPARRPIRPIFQPTTIPSLLQENLQRSADWKDRDVFLYFGAVKSAFYVWVNGRYAGYSEDAKTPAEWNITRFLKEETTGVALQVFRWSDGSYLECQDFWRIRIERDVDPRGPGPDRGWARADLTADGRNGFLDVSVEVTGRPGGAGGLSTVEITSLTAKAGQSSPPAPG